MTNKQMSTGKLALVMTVSMALIGGVGQASGQKMLAQNDLPSVPLDVTDPEKQSVDSESDAAPGQDEATRKQQEQARQKRREQAQQIKEQSKQVAKQNGGKAKKAVEQAQDAARGDDKQNENQKVDAEPGLNEIVQISRGHPNRVMVPFNEPEIRTTSNDAEISAKGSVIYVATKSARPVTLFVTPKNNDRVAISLTLVPKPVPPQQIEVELEGQYQSDIVQSNPKARDWEERTPYVDTLISVFKELAKNDLPQGYTLRDPQSHEQASTCSVDPRRGDVSFETAQIVEGHNITVDVVVATNEGNRPVEVVGSQCAGDGVMGAAEWPRSVLEPGEKTEVFVARQRLDEREAENNRPSTIQE